MNIDDLLQQGRKMWGEKLPLDFIVICMGVVYGDICRQARNQREGDTVDDAELKKELGNMILSTIRWCDDLGYDPKECIELAKKAQAQYASSLG